MKIDFNNVRKQACYAYDRLCDKLNYSILTNSQEYVKPNGFNHITNIDGFVLIDAEYIKKEMDDLRQLIGTIAFTYEEDNPDFIDVYPTDKSLTIFNEESN